MRKPLLFLFALFISLGTISDAVNQTKPKEGEGVQDVMLDKTEAILACPGRKSKTGYCDEEGRKINIHTIAENAEKNGLQFYYLVSGGKIIGSGKDVVWDFTNAKSGKYIIAVGVGKNGTIQGSLKTKTVSVFECECHPSCLCATISVSGPNALTKVGEDMIFTANVSGGSQDSVIYNWTVSNGKITEGQGTSRIVVKTTKEMKGQTVTATVDVGGLCASECPRNASSTGEVDNQ